MSESPQRVYVHVGVPKSGTTFLQSSLAENQDPLLEQGVLYPCDGSDVMFRAAVDVRGSHQAWGRTRAEIDGTWAELCRKARRHPGTTVISHELLAAAGARQVASALSLLEGLDVHIVVTARDPARQATAEWQEGIKHGRSLSFAQFRDRVLTGDGSHDHARRYAANQDLPDVLARWGSAVPSDPVHVVCCPEPGADPAELWRLFGSVVGFDADAFAPADAAAANSSLGVVQVDLLRRVNAALDRRLRQPEYGRVVKQYFAKGLLAAHPSARPGLPDELYDDLVHVGEQWAKEVDRAGWQVHGDLRRLVPSRPETPAPDPDEVDRDAEVATAAAAIAELLVELERTQARVSALEADKKTLKKKRKSLKRKLAEARANG